MDSSVFHPELVLWHSLDYQWCYGPGQGFHAATVVKCLWYAWPAPPRQQKSKGCAQQRKTKKRHQKRHWNPNKFLFAVLSHPHAMIIQRIMYICVFSSLKVWEVGCEIRSLFTSAPWSCYHRLFSSSLCHHLSLLWNLRLSVILPVTDLAITHFTQPSTSLSLHLLVLATLTVSHKPIPTPPPISLSLPDSHLPFLRGSFV